MESQEQTPLEGNPAIIEAAAQAAPEHVEKEPTERPPHQEVLFQEDKERQLMHRLEGDIRYKAGEVRDALKRCSAYSSLLKDGPKNVHDIYFRCEAGDLAIDTLKLLGTQARELAAIFEDCSGYLNKINDWEEQVKPLRIKYGPKTAEEVKQAEQEQLEQKATDIIEGNSTDEGDVENDELDDADGYEQEQSIEESNGSYIAEPSPSSEAEIGGPI